MRRCPTVERGASFEGRPLKDTGIEPARGTARPGRSGTKGRRGRRFRKRREPLPGSGRRGFAPSPARAEASAHPRGGARRAMRPSSPEGGVCAVRKLSIQEAESGDREFFYPTGTAFSSAPCSSQRSTFIASRVAGDAPGYAGVPAGPGGKRSGTRMPARRRRTQGVGERGAGAKTPPLTCLEQGTASSPEGARALFASC